MFRTDALENMLVFLALKTTRSKPTEDIHSEGLAYLVPELFDTNRGVGLTFSPQDRCTFSTHNNAMMLLCRRFGCCLNESTLRREKIESSQVHH